ncbi:MAG TPA: hypothetical protein PLC42_01890 [Parachlamydiaceae bacterium]|nr:hypothetical protein [Parachlamydiaceae bacterium]
MQAKDRLMFRVLLNKFHPKTMDAFLKNMPASLAKEISDQTILANDPMHLLSQPQLLIEKVHYSWLLDSFKQLPDGLKPSVLAALPEAHANGISKAFKFPVQKIDHSPPFKRFLINFFYSRFEKKEVLPLEFLPETELNVLTSFSKPMLVAIIDYLGIYDLAEEVRHIVEKNLLTSLYAVLSPKKQHFLKLCLNQKEKLVTPRLGIESWDGQKESLEKILHKRGLIRLSHALTGAHPDFLWHIVHLLDSGRGTIIAAHYKPDQNPAVSAALTAQVLNVINFLNKKS